MPRGKGKAETELKASSIVLLFLLIFMLFPSLVPLVTCDPAAILHVSLPGGIIVGPSPDPWLNEGWLLEFSGSPQTFTVRINNTSEAQRSYDTRIVIVLNNVGYSNLQSLIVNSIPIPKSAFQYGTPTPYNIWTWPAGDVYPTWFNDTLVNIETIERKGSADVTVSVTFSNVDGIRMHFDAWGKKVTGTPTVGDVTHSPNSEDSTVLFHPGPLIPRPPIPDFSYEPPYPNTGEMVTFNASKSYDPDGGTIVSYAWDFGDGTPIVVENDPITTHAYAAFGSFTVNLTVTDDESQTASKTGIVDVRQRPVASFNFSPIDLLEDDLVTFDASTSSADGGTIVSYEWDFGDGSPHVIVTYPITTHTYTTYGTYTVTLNVTDSEGKWDTESKNVTVILPCVGPGIDAYTQKDPYNGKGLNKASDAFAPQEEVILYAYVSYYCDPVQNKLVAFEVYDPNGTAFLYRTDDSDVNGIATITFRIPSTPIFGTWTAYATVEVAGIQVQDTLTFKVGWIVEITHVETTDSTGAPKTTFAKGTQIHLNITVVNIAFVPKITTITIVIYGEAGVPIGQLAISDFAVPSGTSYISISLPIPNWAFVGLGTIHVNAYTDLPQLNGTPYCPELSTTFLIVKP